MNKKSFIYIVIASILWGTSGIFFHLLEPYGFSPVQMTAMRGTVSAIVMLVFVLLRDRTLFRVRFREFIIFACSGIFIFGTAFCYYASMQASSVSTAVILMYTAPIFVMAFSVAFFGEKLNLAKGVSVVLMLIGCALVSGVVGGMTFNYMGVIFDLASGISYSAYNIFAKIQMTHHSNALSATLYCFIVMAIVALCAANPPEMAALTAQNPAVILPLMIGIGVCTCVLPYFLYTQALRDIPVGTASALGMIEPLAATVFSVLFFQERLGVASVCGILLILLAVYNINRQQI